MFGAVSLRFQQTVENVWCTVIAGEDVKREIPSWEKYKRILDNEREGTFSETDLSTRDLGTDATVSIAELDLRPAPKINSGSFIHCYGIRAADKAGVRATVR